MSGEMRRAVETKAQLQAKLARLEPKITRLTAKIDVLKDVLRQQDLAGREYERAAERRLQRILNALERVEYVGFDARCPWCRGYAPPDYRVLVPGVIPLPDDCIVGHREDCERQKALWEGGRR